MRGPGRALPPGLEGGRGTSTRCRDAGLFFIICCKSQKPIGFATDCRSLQMSGGLREGSFCPHLRTCLPGVAVGGASE